MLQNHNVFIGWGNNPFVSEHDEAGNLLFWGAFAKDTVMNYRAMKFEWDGMPTDSPALWSYSRTADPFSPTSFYVSWNGATRVKQWKFYGAMNMTGPWTLLDKVNKTGFETEYTNASFYLWSKVEGLDHEGNVLGKSETKYTFVPSAELREFCADSTCLDAPGYGFPGEEAARPFIPPIGVNTVPWIDPDNPGSNIWINPSGYPHSSGTLKYSSGWDFGRKYTPDFGPLSSQMEQTKLITYRSTCLGLRSYRDDSCFRWNLPLLQILHAKFSFQSTGPGVFRAVEWHD